MTEKTYVRITDINSVEKKRRTIEFFKKYLGRDIDSNRLKNEITLYISTELELERNRIIEISLINISINNNIDLCRTIDYDSSIISLPDYCVDLILSRSKIKNALIYLLNRGALDVRGGFDWGSTKEGYEFWDKIIYKHDIDLLEKTETVLIKINNIDSEDKKKRTCEFINKYFPKLDFMSSAFIGSSVGFEVEIQRNRKTDDVVGYKLVNLIINPGETDIPCKKFKFNWSAMSYPDEVLDLLISRSLIKNILVYLWNMSANISDGGFDWEETTEGIDYWLKLTKRRYNDSESKTLNNDMNFVEIINIDTEEKEQRIKTVLKKYCKFPVPSMILKGNGIRLGFDVTRNSRGNIININLIQATIIHDRSGTIGDYFNTVFNLPDEVIDKLIKKSRLKKLEPYIMDLYACFENGGFDWDTSEEGESYWNKLIAYKDFSKPIKTNSTMCKIDYKNGKLISKEAIEEKRVGYCVRDTKLALDKELLDKEQERSNIEDELKTFKCEYPLNLENIISRERRLAELDQEIKIIKDLQKEFGFEKSDDEKKGK